tara:strand:- start:3860 stop:4609 length:750 start_codon:yes stop_codon:yes gene_type:complete
MTYSIKECCILFEIPDILTVTKSQIRKKYHKLCLKYHPDKTRHDQSNEMFMKVQKCYEIVLNYKDNVDEKREIQNEEETLYDYFLSFFNVDNLEKIISWIKEYNKHNVIQLHVAWEQVVNKEIYVHENNYIPLWHKTIHLKHSEDNERLFYIMVSNMPKYIKRLDNNDLIVYDTSTPLCSGEKYKIYICESKVLQLTITPEIMVRKYHIFLKQGIPRQNANFIYDIGEISNVIVVFTTQIDLHSMNQSY